MARPHIPPVAPIHEAAALHRAGRLAEAAAIYQKILRKNPRDPDALHLLGLATAQQGDARNGLATIKKALSIRDDFPDAHANAVQLAAQLGDLALAEAHARKVTVYRKNPAAYTILGRLLREQNKHDEALSAFRAAHECNPRDIEGYVSYSLGLRMTGDLQAMLAVAQAGLKLAPDHPTLQNRACEAYFGLGQFQSGWHAYRSRFRFAENRVPAKSYPAPSWEGEDLSGRRLLIWAEQSPGDEIMYANMYADAIARAGSVVIQCSPRLAPLMRRSFPTADILDRDLTAEELKAIDVQTPAASMGEWLRTSRDAFPNAAGYLHADPELRDALRARYLGENKNHVLVGIAWRSANTINADDKSTSVLNWGPILKVPGVTFVDLQYGDHTVEISEATRGFGVSILKDPSIDPLKDMDAYAAQVAAMDIVVSSSNTAAHVAGSLGIPTICMLPVSLDRGRRCYWMFEGARTPWYPSMQLVMQRQAGEWLDVIRDAGLELLERVAASREIPTAEYYRNIISGFAAINRPGDAEVVYAHMARDPKLAAEAFVGIGDFRKAALDASGTFAACEKALAADPGYWPAYNLKALTLYDLNRYDEAIAVYTQGLVHNGKSHALHSNLARAYHQLGRYSEALHHHREAIENTPAGKASTLDRIRVNYGLALHDSGDSVRALEMLETVLAHAPDNVDAHYNRALILLSQERWVEGWREWAWRLKRPNAAMRHEIFPHIKPWAGESLAGKKILIWGEHGIGDEILTSTMIADAVAAARKTVVLCSARLVPLFRRSFPRAQVDAIQTPLPPTAMASDFDYQIGAWDLGAMFRPDSASFAPQPGHLLHDAKLSARLREKYKSIKPGNLIVGISWASPANQEMGWLKASKLESWQPILTRPGVTFVNLQYGDQSPILAHIKDQFGVEVVNDAEIDPLKNMDSYAAQVAAMDIIISTSNTLVHTAGAIGTPTWVLLGKGRGQIWYWLHDRSDSVWYSSIRLIRQEIAGDWTPVMERCARDLDQLIREKKAGTT